MERTQTLGILSAVFALCCLVLMVTPWWGVSVTNAGTFGGVNVNNSGGASAGPFDDGPNLIKGANATMAGILVLLAMLASGAAAFVFLARPAMARLAGMVVGVSGFFVFLLVILAPTTWPPEGVGFWDSFSNSQFGVTQQGSTYALFGWYFAIPVTAVAAYVVLRTLKLDAPATSAQASSPSPVSAATPVAQPPASMPAVASAPSKAQEAEAAPKAVSGGQCTATTKAGSRCARKATAGAFCATHA